MYSGCCIIFVINDLTFENERVVYVLRNQKFHTAAGGSFMEYGLKRHTILIETWLNVHYSENKTIPCVGTGILHVSIVCDQFQ